ncbi:MAG: LysR family transcriptional regulator [Rhodocyclaceae bacterium]
MDLRQLEYFVSVVESGSFSRAAVALNLTQPSLSRQIALLEHELGQRLLVRTGHGTTPTEAGELLLVHARSMLETARRTRDALREMNTSPSGRVVVGLPPRVAVRLSVPFVERFRTRFPRAVVTILEGLSVSLRESLIAGRLDLALLFDPPASPQLEYEPLARERLLLVAPSNYPLDSHVGLTELAGYPLILPSAPNAIRSLIEALIRPLHLELQIVAEVGAVPTALALVEKGIGCSIVPESAFTEPRYDSLARAPIGPPEILNTLVLATPIARPATRLTREAAALLRQLDFRQSV